MCLKLTDVVVVKGIFRAEHKNGSYSGTKVYQYQNAVLVIHY